MDTNIENGLALKASTENKFTTLTFLQSSFAFLDSLDHFANLRSILGEENAEPVAVEEEEHV